MYISPVVAGFLLGIVTTIVVIIIIGLKLNKRGK